MTNDLIRRQDATKNVRNLQTYKLFEGDDMLLVDVAEVLTELMMLPSAQPEQGCNECVFKPFKQFQPERKKGEWIDDNCSECGQYVYHGDMRRYCPRCGAEMRGEA